ncbi:TetR/AcrR family transcriptional regulator [Kitasatospora fiedleri]|uniref:TetR/AcrR family transcriptional regulator n=1 Tax=Kitasatospora fiedleri TaxID=2991545 RepID=UPI002989E08A|nr:TetR family transcriptional regulator [Kitasatospora fiedleri]
MSSRHDDAAGAGLVWERPEPPARRTPGPLSRALIVAAALELADADGLEGVSIRRVAAALEVGPMRLYGYVETKAELLELMVDAVYAEIAPDPADDRPARTARSTRSGEWREELRAIAGRYRAAALRHEWFIDLLGGRPHLGRTRWPRGRRRWPWCGAHRASPGGRPRCSRRRGRSTPTWRADCGWRWRSAGRSGRTDSRTTSGSGRWGRT